VLFPDGYDAIINLLAAGLDIRLNQVVNTIKYSGAGVEVMTNSGQKITGDYALITLPLGVLKSGSVRFDPVLPAGKTNLINKIEMGMVNKIALQWDNRFWPETLQYMGYANPTKGKYTYFLNVKTFAPVNALMTFGFGQFGRTLEDQTDAEIESDIVAILKNMFGSSSVPNPKGILVTRWTKDPYARGAYSYNNVGVTIDDFETLSEPVNNKLFFAGEHCSRLYKGTVHGAYLSGQREADRILGLVGASILKTHTISGIEMTCYPNPSMHVVAVRFTGQKKPMDATLLLKDSSAAVVWQEKIRISAGGSYEQQLSLGSLASGSYWLEAVIEGGVIISKVVKL
jgi:monoamine oxidase